MPNLETMYRLPWRTTDNPNGWLEPTTRCQLRCEGCYRGCDKGGGVDRPQAELKEEIDTLIRCRNIQTVTIGGGEPLLYPELDGLALYAHSRGLNVMVSTNGVLLNEERLNRLAAARVGRVMVHMQAGQGNDAGDTEELVRARRESVCRLFRKQRSVTLGFLFTSTAGNMGEADLLIEQSRRNSDVVRVVFFMMRQDPVSGADPGRPESEALMRRIEQGYGMKFCAYLGRTLRPGASWLMGGMVYAGGRMLGSVDGNVYRHLQEVYRENNGRYVYISNQSWSESGLSCSFAVRNSSLRRIALRWLRTGLKMPLCHQSIVLLRTPEKTADDWDRCDGCPDTMILGNRMVPCCLLEAVRQGRKVCGLEAIW